MTTATVVIDNTYTSHATKVSESLSEFAPDTNLHYMGHIRYSRDMIDNYKYVTSNLAGSVDAITWPFSYGEDHLSKYIYDGPVRDAFVEGTAVVSSAGNFGDNLMPETQRYFFDFTVASIKTFEWDEDDFVGDRATKDAVWEVADFSNQNPQFVDFYTYGDGGTSYAAPRVAGLIAQIRDQNPDVSLSSIRTILEKNSTYEFVEPSLTYSPDRDPIEYGSWYIQVLDPYDLQNNLVRDGKTGYEHLIFSNSTPVGFSTHGVSESEYVFDFTFDDTIDTRVRTEALYEVYLNRNPDQEGLDWWVDRIDDEGTNFNDVIDFFKHVRDNDLDGAIDVSQYDHGAPLIEKIQGLYHAHLGRESGDAEVVTAIDYMTQNNMSWEQYVGEWTANAYIG